MKFSDGQWQIRKGVRVYNPAEVNDLETDGNSITVYAPCRHINDRSATLDGPLLTFRFSAPLPNIICVQIFHYTGGVRKGPEFKLLEQSDFPVEINRDDTAAYLTSGNLTVRVKKENDWAVDFYNGAQRLTGSGPGGAGYIITDDQGVFVNEQLSLGVGECIYGLGERFTPFVKNGQVVEIWNEDGGTDTEQAYKNIPFYLTNKGYGVFVNHPEKVFFEVGSERVSKVQFSVAGEYLEYYIINGPTPKEVLERYTALTGRPALPPSWSFGLWLTTSFTTDYDEKTVNHFIDGMAERDLPLAVFHFDCFWMKEYHWCNFEWDHRVFPDPQGMLARLKAKGLKICLWINPYIAQRSDLFAEGKKRDYLLKKPDGDVWQWDKWQAGMGIVDFTNPEACQWFAAKLRGLLEMGVDCFKTDFGERIPTDVVYYDGSDPMKMHNYYAYLYNKVVFGVLEEKFGKGNAVVFARSATVGSQKFPVHWGGDCWANYESMAESLRGGLSLSLSGFGFWSHDIGGFEKTATADLYKRWVAFGLLSSHSRLHGSSSYRVPWLFDEEAVDVLRFFTKLKCSLMPYLFATACEASQRGIPVMRPMFLEFPDDPACDYLDRQYMLGEALLVAPIFSDDGFVSYYLPEGNWTNFFTGEQLKGGCWRKERYDYFSLPLMARANTVIPVGKVDYRPDYDYIDDVTLQVFVLEERILKSTIVYNMDGTPGLKVNIQQTGKMVTIEAEEAQKPWNVLFREIREFVEVKGGIGTVTEDGVRIKIEPGINIIVEIVF